jgi:3-deoxy-D-manno-octulosonic-acid transferase
MRPIYSLLFLALLPFILVRIYLKGRAQPAYRERIGERLGLYDGPAPKIAPVWIHAVSVGECEASFPLVRRLQAAWPDLPILMTCTTPTGSSRIQTVLGDTVFHVYLPYDLPWITRRFLRYFRPRIGIIMETEIWPNLFAGAREAKIPLMIANGRLSERSVRGYERLSSLIKPSLSAVHCIAAQSEQDTTRYKRIGANEGSVRNCGNIKFDIAWDVEQAKASQALKSAWFAERKVIVAGSTHPGEEILVLRAFKRVRDRFPDALMVMVPRHPERGQSVIELCCAEGLNPLLFSETHDLPVDNDVLVIDRIGELRRFYGACQVAFIGGSLVPHGGQNPLEPLVAKIPVIFGPHMTNFEEIRNSILEVKAGVEVRSDSELSEQLIFLLENSLTAKSMGERGELMVHQNQGAVTRIYELTAELIHQSASSSSGSK